MAKGRLFNALDVWIVSPEIAWLSAQARMRTGWTCRLQRRTPQKDLWAFVGLLQPRQAVQFRDKESKTGDNVTFYHCPGAHSVGPWAAPSQFSSVSLGKQKGIFSSFPRWRPASPKQGASQSSGEKYLHTDVQSGVLRPLVTVHRHLQEMRPWMNTQL